MDGALNYSLFCNLTFSVSLKPEIGCYIFYWECQSIDLISNCVKVFQSICAKDQQTKCKVMKYFKKGNVFTA